MPPADRPVAVREILGESFRRFGAAPAAEPRLESLQLARILHTLGTALEKAAARSLIAKALAGLPQAEAAWLASLGLPASAGRAPRWPRLLCDAAFETIGRTIVLTRTGRSSIPRNALRTDEIVWGRAPARLDLGGGWSDTPPYSLEHGGCVINAAVDLNGQSADPGLRPGHPRARDPQSTPSTTARA